MCTLALTEFKNNLQKCFYNITISEKKCVACQGPTMKDTYLNVY